MIVKEKGSNEKICASPNDVPGYDKDQYIDPEILAKVKGGSILVNYNDTNRSIDVIARF